MKKMDAGRESHAGPPSCQMITLISSASAIQPRKKSNVSLWGGIPRSLDPETVIVPGTLQDRQSSAWVRTDGLIAQKYDRRQELFLKSSARPSRIAAALPPARAKHSSPTPIHTNSRNRRSNAKVMPVTSE